MEKSDKPPAACSRIFERHADGAAHTVMVGNSMRSDILPALAAGSYGVFVPHDLTWACEHAEEPRYGRIAHLGELAAVVAGFDADH